MIDVRVYERNTSILISVDVLEPIGNGSRVAVGVRAAGRYAVRLRVKDSSGVNGERVGELRVLEDPLNRFALRLVLGTTASRFTPLSKV